MYLVIKTDGTELGMTDSVYYIKIGQSGSYAPCPAADAIGVAFNGTVYNLIGREDIADADTVVVVKCDAGELASHQQNLVDELILSALEV